MNEDSQHEAGPATPLPQHTPGPWRYDPEFGEVVAGEASIPIPPTGLSVERAHIVAESVTRSNGLLIAAAPDLLAALKEITTSLAWVDTSETSILARAVAAIAKAQGRDAE